MASPTDRIPPHSPEAEAGALACALIDQNHVPTLNPEWFYENRHQATCNVLREMFNAGEPVNSMTFMERVIRTKKDQTVGGLEYISSLPDKTASSEDFPQWKKILVEQWCLRKMIQVCSTAINKGYNKPDDVASVIEEFEQSALSIRQSGVAEESDMKAICLEIIREMEEAVANKGKITGVTTGLSDLDYYLNGLKPGQLFIVAARPGCGKTSLAMQIAAHVAIRCKEHVGIITAEMSDIELTKRILYSEASVDSDKHNKGTMDDGESKRITTSLVKVNSKFIHIVDTSGMTIAQVRAKARRMKQQHNIKLLVVDYLQLIRAGAKTSNRNEEITLVSNGMKLMAKEIKCPVICLAQLNRATEKEDRRPKVSDLRDSGSIEQDADIVGLLHPKAEGETDLIIGKNRSGKTGDIHLLFEPEFTRFKQLAKINPNDIP